MHLVAQFLFLLITLFAVFLFTKKLRGIRRNIFAGRALDLTDRPRERWRNVMLQALGQRKMFRNPLVAVLHL